MLHKPNTTRHGEERKESVWNTPKVVLNKPHSCGIIFIIERLF